MKKHYILLFSLFSCLTIAQLQANFLTDFAQKAYNHAWQIAGTAVCSGSAVLAGLMVRDIIKHGLPHDWIGRCYYSLAPTAMFVTGLLCFKAHSLSQNLSVSAQDVVLQCMDQWCQAHKDAEIAKERIKADREKEFLEKLDQETREAEARHQKFLEENFGK